MIGDLVKRHRLALRLTQTKLGTLTGLQQDYISKLERGNIDLPQKGTLMALAAALGVTLADFYRAAGVLVEEDEQPQPDRAIVSTAQPLMPMVFPVYDQPVSAGKGAPSVQEYMYLPPETTMRANWYGLPVRGDCMVPRLAPGDVVLVNPDGQPEPGDMVVVDIDDEIAMVKWFVKRKDAYFLEPEQGDAILYDEDRVRLVGVVMGVFGKKPRKGRR